MMTRKHAMTGAAMALVMIMGGGANAAAITPPSEAFAQNPGSDYFLADYTAYEAYLKTLASQSDRMKLVDIGKSEEGRTQWVAIVSSPANLAKLDHYKSIAKRLAKAEGDAARFDLIANEYRAAPEVTRKRLYLETMQQVLQYLKK